MDNIPDVPDEQPDNWYQVVSRMTVPQLISTLREQGVTGYSGKTKEELITMLEESQSIEPETITPFPDSYETEYPLIEETPLQEYAPSPRRLTYSLNPIAPGVILRSSDPRLSKAPTRPTLREEVKDIGIRRYSRETKPELEKTLQEYHPLKFPEHITPETIAKYREDIIHILEEIGWSPEELEDKALGELEDMLQYEQPPLRLPISILPRKSRISKPPRIARLTPAPSPFAPPTDNEIEDLPQRRLNILMELQNLGWTLDQLRGKPMSELEEMLQREQVIPRPQHPTVAERLVYPELAPMEKLTITELRELAQEAGIEDYALMSRSELLRLLKEIASGMK